MDVRMDERKGRNVDEEGGGGGGEEGLLERES